MSHYAKCVPNAAGKFDVTKVIVADAAFIAAMVDTDPGIWVQTSYNTLGGVHIDSVTRQPDGGVPMRGNYAGIGFTYDQTLDAFYPPKPYPSWVLNPTTFIWEPPTPRPDDGNNYRWNEPSQSWIEVS